MDYNPTADTRSLYIHWPFCPYRCHFCPFVAISGQDHLMGQYHTALRQEITQFAQKTPNKLTIETIYLGGGTPSTWPNELLLDMSGTLKEMFDLANLTEMTLEVNPGTVTQDQIAVWQKAGINRLSIGVQSLDDVVLQKLNRHQKVSDVYKLLEWVAGKFKVISVDVIIGLPGVTDKQWKAMIQELVTWPIQHVSMYFLSVHENTPLYTRLVNNELRLPPQDPLVDLYHWTIETFEKAGLMQYEISSFAKVGFESQHNQVYWDHKPYKGFGIGACSFDGKYRYQNMKTIGRYLQKADKKEVVESTAELITNEQKRLEMVMLGLRRMKGLVIADATATMTEQQKRRFFETMVLFEQEGLVKRVGERLYLSKSALAVENEVALRLLK